jgi:hypothetical protein
MSTITHENVLNVSAKIKYAVLKAKQFAPNLHISIYRLQYLRISKNKDKGQGHLWRFS